MEALSSTKPQETELSDVHSTQTSVSTSTNQQQALQHFSGNIYFINPPEFHYSDENKLKEEISGYMNTLGKNGEQEVRIGALLSIGGNRVDTEEFKKAFKSISDKHTVKQTMASFYSSKNKTNYDEKTAAVIINDTDDSLVYKTRDTRVKTAKSMYYLKFYHLPHIDQTIPLSEDERRKVLRRVWLLSQIQPIAIQAHTNQNLYQATLTLIIANYWVNAGWVGNRQTVLDHLNSEHASIFSTLSDLQINTAFDDAFAIYETTPHYNTDFDKSPAIDVTKALTIKHKEREGNEMVTSLITSVEKYVKDKKQNKVLTQAQKKDITAPADEKSKRLAKIVEAFYYDVDGQKAVIQPKDLADTLLCIDAALSDAVLYLKRKGTTRFQGDAVGAVKDLRDKHLQSMFDQNVKQAETPQALGQAISPSSDSAPKSENTDSLRTPLRGKLSVRMGVDYSRAHTHGEAVILPGANEVNVIRDKAAEKSNAHNVAQSTVATAPQKPSTPTTAPALQPAASGKPQTIGKGSVPPPPKKAAFQSPAPTVAATNNIPPPPVKKSVPASQPVEHTTSTDKKPEVQSEQVSTVTSTTSAPAPQSVEQAQVASKDAQPEQAQPQQVSFVEASTVTSTTSAPASQPVAIEQTQPQQVSSVETSTVTSTTSGQETSKVELPVAVGSASMMGQPGIGLHPAASNPPSSDNKNNGNKKGKGEANQNTSSPKKGKKK